MKIGVGAYVSIWRTLWVLLFKDFVSCALQESGRAKIISHPCGGRKGCQGMAVAVVKNMSWISFNPVLQGTCFSTAVKHIGFFIHVTDWLVFSLMEPEKV